MSIEIAKIYFYSGRYHHERKVRKFPSRKGRPLIKVFQLINSKQITRLENQKILQYDY